MTFEFRADREAHLRMLCEEMGRSVDDFINEAVLTFMEDYEDGRDAQAARAQDLQSGERNITLEELMEKYGLDAGNLTDGSEAVGKAGQAGEEEADQFSLQPSRQAA
jgi:predicted DNA-binding protein